MNHTGLLVVPVAGSETLALRSGRLPTGERVGIAFSTESRLIQVMGPGQRWIHLAVPALKAMLAPLGIDQVQVDPGLIAPRVTPAPLSTGTPLSYGRPRPARTPAGRGVSREPLPPRTLVKEFT
jgi:hypothetical protein